MLGAIGATVWTDRREAAAREVPLVDGTPERIVVRRPGFRDVVLVRGPAADADAPDWRLESPCPLDAIDARVAPLVEALAAARLVRPVDGVDLPGAGLDPPVATLEVDGERIDGERIDVGGPDLGGERRYVRRGDAVGFAPEWLGSLVGGGASAFAEPAVIAAGAAVAVDGDASRAPAWNALEAVQTVDWPLRDPPPEASARAVTVELAHGGVERFEVTSTDAWHAIRPEGADCARVVALDALAR